MCPRGWTQGKFLTNSAIYPSHLCDILKAWSLDKPICEMGMIDDDDDNS